MTSRLFWRIVFAALFVFITWASLTPDPEQAPGGMALTRWLSMSLFGDARYADKIAHFTAYGALGGAAVFARFAIAGGLAGLAGALALYGALMEGAQRLGGVRTLDIADAAANAAGALTGVLAAAFLTSAVLRRLQKR